MMLIFVLFIVLFCSFVESKRFPYDHMNTTYYGQEKFKPLELKNYPLTVTPVFSPDRSIQLLTNLVNSANHSIDIMQPYFSSWLSECKSGCTAADVHSKETFPIFQVVLNKLHSGVKVRIIANDYERPLDEGKMDLMTFFQVAGAEIRYFTSLPYTHSKVIIIDGNVISISSINFSENSFMDNREAGLILSDTYYPDAQLSEYVQSVFDYDFEKGYIKELQQYTPEDIAICKNTTYLPFLIPDPKTFSCKTASPTPTEFYGYMDLTVFISPDYAFDYIIPSLDEAKKNMKIFLYSIEPENMCDAILRGHERGIETDVFVSSKLFSKYETGKSYECYCKLYEAGINVRRTVEKCLTYSHNKYWFVDDDTLFVSTGNWEDIDVPSPPYTFPPYWESGYRRVQRDYHVMVKGNSELNEIFMKVYNNDYEQGYDFKPST